MIFFSRTPWVYFNSDIEGTTWYNILHVPKTLEVGTQNEQNTNHYYIPNRGSVAGELGQN